MSDHSNVPNPIAKAVAAWGGVGVAEVLQSAGITTWGDAAAAAAAIYTGFLILEWMSKKIYALCKFLKARRAKAKPHRLDGGGT